MEAAVRRRRVPRGHHQRGAAAAAVAGDSSSSNPQQQHPDLDDSDDENVSRGRADMDADNLADGDEDTDSALDEMPDLEEEEEEDAAAASAGAADKTSPSKQGLLDSLPPRWKNLVVRGFAGAGLISGFSFLVYMGASGLLFLVGDDILFATRELIFDFEHCFQTYLVLTSCYSEVTRLAYKVTGASRSTYGPIVWGLFLLCNYYLVRDTNSDLPYPYKNKLTLLFLRMCCLSEK